ncbi:MAG: hypothetical protein M0Z36_06615 [Thermaerobacter sp.]|nr:hypothetical protein [Thermaerobacter sp.]
MLLRHGDVLIEAIDTMPDNVHPREGRVVAWGEATGHSHALGMDDLLYEAPDGTVYIRATEDTEITHEEHGVIPIPAGLFRVTYQREFDPYEQASRRVVD